MASRRARARTTNDDSHDAPVPGRDRVVSLRASIENAHQGLDELIRSRTERKEITRQAMFSGLRLCAGMAARG